MLLVFGVLLEVVSKFIISALPLDLLMVVRTGDSYFLIVFFSGGFTNFKAKLLKFFFG